jgi:flagellar basal body rod protein FlgG
MSGSYYIALSGMHAGLEALDRLATDLANASTVGYKAQRGTTAQADRTDFNALLHSAIDVTDGPTRADLRPGEVAPTGRELDTAIDGPGMFAVITPSGTRYTRTGKFTRRSDGVLTSSGMELEGEDGKPITLGQGPVKFGEDGTVTSAGEVVGKLKIVEFQHPESLNRQGPDLFSADGQVPQEATDSEVRSGVLEQSNVSVVERMSELTSVSRNFGTMERALSLLSNDVDLKAITELGRH